MTDLTITAHALKRYRERIADLPEAAILAHLDTPAVQTAIAIGAPYVRLATRHRVVIKGSTIVTILPADCRRGFVARWGRA